MVLSSSFLIGLKDSESCCVATVEFLKVTPLAHSEKTAEVQVQAVPKMIF
jgi:hypothetical protein